MKNEKTGFREIKLRIHVLNSCGLIEVTEAEQIISRNSLFSFGQNLFSLKKNVVESKTERKIGNPTIRWDTNPSDRKGDAYGREQFSD